MLEHEDVHPEDLELARIAALQRDTFLECVRSKEVCDVLEIFHLVVVTCISIFFLFLFQFEDILFGEGFVRVEDPNDPNSPDFDLPEGAASEGLDVPIETREEYIAELRQLPRGPSRQVKDMLVAGHNMRANVKAMKEEPVPEDPYLGVLFFYLFLYFSMLEYCIYFSRDACNVHEHVARDFGYDQRCGGTRWEATWDGRRDQDSNEGSSGMHDLGC